MRSSVIGKSTSQVEVQDITKYGIWLYIKNSEYFLSYKDFPWFQDAKVFDIYHVEILHHQHLYWPELDIDIELDSLKNPENYPLYFK